jgi:peptidoglycan hydrolase-like protein with peptidoglycan-binding domain
LIPLSNTAIKEKNLIPFLEFNSYVLSFPRRRGTILNISADPEKCTLSNTKYFPFAGFYVSRDLLT